jgi:hypothetical protein
MIRARARVRSRASQPAILHGVQFMAISAVEYSMWRSLAEQKKLPPNPDVLEFGEANWYGDVPIPQLVQDIQKFAAPDVAPELTAAMNELQRRDLRRHLFDLAKIFYKTFTNYKSITAIDLHGTSAALKHNLNEPVPLDRKFNITINTGTAEHVFNQYQMFKTMHELTVPGGIMFHTSPFQGWLDHGFYNYNPTIFVDMAAINDYSLVIWVYGEISPLKIVQLQRLEQVHEMAKRGELGKNSVHIVVMTKPPEEKPFAAPMQGYYAEKLSAKAKEDWYKLR